MDLGGGKGLSGGESDIWQFPFFIKCFYSPPAGVRAGQGGGAGVGIILGGDCFHLI